MKERLCVRIFRMPARTVGFSGMEYAFTCVYKKQAERRWSTAHLLASWEQGRTTAWWSCVQGGGLSVIPVAGMRYKLTVMACHILKRTQADPLCLSENLISSHARYSNRAKNSLPDLVLNPGWRESSARQASRHCGILTVVFAHWAARTGHLTGSLNIDIKANLIEMMYVMSYLAYLLQVCFSVNV